MKTDKELRKIAKDICHNLIFLSFRQEEIRMCFPILFFIEPEQLPKDIGSIFEYYSEAMPRSINGKPMFMSAHFLTTDETKKVLSYVKEMESFLEKFDSDE